MVVTLGESPNTRHCFIDTAASGNFTPKIEDLHDFEPFISPRSFTAANGAEVQSKGNGTIKIEVSNCGRSYTVNVPHVQWVPDIYRHLFSPGQLIKDGFAVNLHKEGCTVKDPANRLLADICERGNTYPANFSIIQPQSPLPIVQALVEPTKRELDDQLNDAVLALTVKTDYDAMRWHQ
jgi:Pol polyprotein, beta-barrel domain